MKRLCLLAGAWYAWSFAFLPGLRPPPTWRHKRNVAVSAVSSGKTQSQTYKVGDEVLTYYAEDCMWYPGRILSIDRNGSYLVKWDVPEDGIEEVRVTSEQMRCALIRVRDLQVGQQFSGVVWEVNSAGAFVDIGAEEHGLLPYGRMAEQWFDNAEDILEEGQTVKVWVSRKKDGHFSLAMVKELIETDLSAFSNLKPDEWVAGVVKSIGSFGGAFVTVFANGLSADGFLHVSELSTSFVSSVEDVLIEGQEVRVRVLSVDVETGRMILSMKQHVDKDEGAKEKAQSRLAALANFSSDQWLQGKVVRVIDVGAFVAVNPATAPAFSDMGTVEGLLHQSQMSASATWFKSWSGGSHGTFPSNVPHLSTSSFSRSWIWRLWHW